MPEPLAPERIAKIRASIDRAHTEIGEVCSEGPRNRFRMSIPANPSRDTDLIVSEALNGAEDLLAEVDRLKAQVSLMGTYLQHESLAAIDKALAERMAGQ